MSSAYGDKFLTFFPIRMPSNSFSCLIALSRTASTYLNMSGVTLVGTDSFAFFSVSGGKAFNLSLLRIILAVEFFLDILTNLMTFPSITSLLKDLFVVFFLLFVLIMNGCQLLSNYFSALLI